MSDITEVTAERWATFLSGLYERGDRLEVREPGQSYPAEEAVDAYVLSGHAEALRSAEVDGDLWGTLHDLEEDAQDEDEAWAKITAFYLDRGCVLVRVTQAPDQDAEPEEWLLERALAERLGLL